MTKVTVEISDSIHQWLNAEAGNRGLPLDEFITSVLAEQQRKLSPTTAEISMLGILQNVSQKFGSVVSAKTIWSIWKIRGTAPELETALRGLISKGFVAESQNGLGYVLTSFGASFPTNPENA